MGANFCNNARKVFILVRVRWFRIAERASRAFRQKDIAQDGFAHAVFKLGWQNAQARSAKGVLKDVALWAYSC